MKIDYSKRKHESPFADYHPEHESPFAADSPKVSPPENVPPKAQSPVFHPERSDKAQFSAFLGTFALIAAVPTGYWANYTYGIYQRNAAVLDYWREHPEKIRNDLMTKASKKLSLDGDVLYVSNYRKEIAVPLSNVEKILWFGDMRPTMIYLKTPSEFGRKINFSPNITATSGLNPIVEELRELVKSNDK